MKSLGKQDVLLIYKVDGKETRRVLQRRAVYEDIKGQMWVSHLSGKRQVRREGSQLTGHITITSIKSHTLQEITARLPNPKT